ncbi:MAG: hypothetical protein JWQ96_3493 [Segetibacter sp.]|nr:hypothetical protein [Segetibacter sp.]
MFVKKLCLRFCKREDSKLSLETRQNYLLNSLNTAYASALSSSRMACYCNGTTRLLLKLLRMFQHAFASLGTQPADVPYAITFVRCATRGSAQALRF